LLLRIRVFLIGERSHFKFISVFSSIPLNGTYLRCPCFFRVNFFICSICRIIPYDKYGILSIFVSFFTWIDYFCFLHFPFNIVYINRPISEQSVLINFVCIALFFTLHVGSILSTVFSLVCFVRVAAVLTCTSTQKHDSQYCLTYQKHSSQDTSPFYCV